ncbi:hypothetical protein [Nibribacter koreensis]
MIIYKSGFLTLHYTPSTDILTVNFPPVEDILNTEISRSFGIIVECTRNYDIKKLLFDARGTQVEVQEETFAPIISHFVKSLATTRVQKIARVASSNLFKEHVVKRVFNDTKLLIQFQSFTELEPAVDWLTQAGIEG